MCNCNNETHRALTVTYTGTTIELTFTNSTDIGSGEPFNIVVCKPVSELVTGAPVPVVTEVNGAAGIPLRDRYGLPLMSNKVPRGTTYGTYIVNEAETDTYIILRTPCYA